MMLVHFGSRGRVQRKIVMMHVLVHAARGGSCRGKGETQQETPGHFNTHKHKRTHMDKSSTRTHSHRWWWSRWWRRRRGWTCSHSGGTGVGGGEAMQMEAPVSNVQARGSGENWKRELRRVAAFRYTAYNDVLQGWSCLCWFCGVPVGRARLVSGWSLSYATVLPLCAQASCFRTHPS